MRRRFRSKNLSLVAAMNRACLSGQALAAEVGMSAGSISALLNQRREPSPCTVERITRVLKVQPDEIFPSVEGGVR